MKADKIMKKKKKGKVSNRVSRKKKQSTKLLNVITLGQTNSDIINQMITLTDDFYLVIINEWDACNMILLSGW